MQKKRFFRGATFRTVGTLSGAVSFVGWSVELWAGKESKDGRMTFYNAATVSNFDGGAGTMDIVFTAAQTTEWEEGPVLLQSKITTNTGDIALTRFAILDTEDPIQ